MSSPETVSGAWTAIGDELPQLGGKTGFESLPDAATPEEIE